MHPHVNHQVVRFGESLAANLAVLEHPVARLVVANVLRGDVACRM